MDAEVTTSLERYLGPVPTPPGMTSREIVRRAIEFDNPPRIPYSFFVPVQSDFFEIAMLRFISGQSLVERPKREVGDVYYDEWGVGHRVTGRAWDHAFDHPLRDLRNLDDYRFPNVAAPERFASMEPYVRRAREAGKYVVGYDPIMGFEKMRALLGFEALMMAPYTQPEGLEALLDRLAALSIAIIEQWARIGGVDGFMTWED